MRALPIDVDRDRLAAICRRFGIRELSVFGSALHGTLREDSDINLLYVRGSDARPGWAYWSELEQALEQLFGRKVDLVSKEGLHWYIRDEVLAEAQVLYAA